MTTSATIKRYAKHPITVGVTAAAATSGIALFFLFRRKAAELKARGQAATVPGGAAEAMKTRLSAYAQQRAPVIARAAAENYLSTTYGLTPERIRKMNQLAAALG